MSFASRSETDSLLRSFTLELTDSPGKFKRSTAPRVIVAGMRPHQRTDLVLQGGRSFLVGANDDQFAAAVDDYHALVGRLH